MMSTVMIKNISIILIIKVMMLTRSWRRGEPRSKLKVWSLSWSPCCHLARDHQRPEKVWLLYFPKYFAKKSSIKSDVFTQGSA